MLRTYAIAVAMLGYLLAGTSCLQRPASQLKDDSNGEARIYLRAFNGSQLSVYTSTATDTGGLMLCKAADVKDTCLDNTTKSFERIGKLKNGRILYGLIFDMTATASVDLILGQQVTSGLSVKRLLTLSPKANTEGETTKATGEFKGGGVYGAQVRQSYTSKAGTKSEYVVYAPKDNESVSYPILIYLHGDYAVDYADQTFGPAGKVTTMSTILKKIAIKYGMIVTSVYSPSALGDMVAWYAEPRKSTEFLDDLIQSELYKKYNIQKSKVYFSGSSGGPQFLLGVFIPLVGNSYRGGALALCGGGGTVLHSTWIANLHPTPEFISNFKILYYTATGDKLYNEVRSSEAYYRTLGFKTKGFYPQEDGHCEFDYDFALNKLLDELATM